MLVARRAERYRVFRRAPLEFCVRGSGWPVGGSEEDATVAGQQKAVQATVAVVFAGNVKLIRACFSGLVRRGRLVGEKRFEILDGVG